MPLTVRVHEKSERQHQQPIPTLAVTWRVHDPVEAVTTDVGETAGQESEPEDVAGRLRPRDRT